MAKHVSPAFWGEAFDQGCSPELLRSLASDIPSFEVFAAVARSEITPRYGAELLAAKRAAERAAEPWIVRLVRWLFGDST